MSNFIKILNTSFAAFLILGMFSFTSPNSHSLNNTKAFEKIGAVCYEGTNKDDVYLFATITFKQDGTFTGGLAGSDGSSTPISGYTDGDKMYLDNGGVWTIYDGYIMTGNGIHMNQVSCK